MGDLCFSCLSSNPTCPHLSPCPTCALLHCENDAQQCASRPQSPVTDVNKDWHGYRGPAANEQATCNDGSHAYGWARRWCGWLTREINNNNKARPAKKTPVRSGGKVVAMGGRSQKIAKSKVYTCIRLDNVVNVWLFIRCYKRTTIRYKVFVLFYFFLINDKTKSNFYLL